MRDVTRDNFGLLIAYLLPGFVALWGVAQHSAAMRAWLLGSGPDAPTVGGFLYATLGSTAAGLIVSAARWALLDRAFARAGIRPPEWDFALFAERLAAFEVLVAHHYRYYQFYANMAVAVTFAGIARLTTPGLPARHVILLSAGALAVESILLLGARDTLRKYYERTGRLLGEQGRRPGPTAPIPRTGGTSMGRPDDVSPSTRPPR